MAPWVIILNCIFSDGFTLNIVQSIKTFHLNTNISGILSFLQSLRYHLQVLINGCIILMKLLFPSAMRCLVYTLPMYLFLIKMIAHVSIKGKHVCMLYRLLNCIINTFFHGHMLLLLTKCYSYYILLPTLFCHLMKVSSWFKFS